GTNVQQGKDILANSGLAIVPANDLGDAAQKIVAEVKKAAYKGGMTENVENLILEHLKRFQASLERIDRRLEELTIRQTDTHNAVLAL
ncbi:hypothetical protein ABTE85_21215, partial [Acinetobacter baumannii]